MRKLLAVLLFTLLPAVAAFADQINFELGFGGANSVTASVPPGSLTSGPAPLQNINDSTTGVTIPFVGKYVNGNTGTTISLGQLGGIVTGFFNAGGANSVLVEDSMSHVLVEGTMEGDSTLISHVPNSTGTFSGTFHVTFVSPAVLALFGLGPGFSPNGSVALTTGGGNFDGTTFTGEIGGGAVTIETTTATPEPTGLGVLGMGLLTIAGGLRRWRARKTS